MGRKAKNPTNFDWTPEREEKLLMFWEENAFLYNLELKDYSKVDKKQRLYEQFAAEMGTTGMFVKKKACTSLQYGPNILLTSEIWTSEI